MLIIGGVQAQYQFKTLQDLSCTSVKNQSQTGTCWSFTTVSFLESELIRLGKPATDLSEMFVVRAIYKDKARNYFLRQGLANFSQGSLSHDVIRAFSMEGILPETGYSGLKEGQTQHNHSALERELKGFVDGQVASRRAISEWMPEFEAILDKHMGSVNTPMLVDDASLTAQEYAKSLDVNPEDYVSLTSFTHHPLYQSFILEIPDNYSNGSYYNVSLEDLKEVAQHALKNGFTVAWDGDVSESTFQARKGLAILPENPKSKWMEAPVTEMEVNSENRQAQFENFATTDDHLMHLVGMSKDQDGDIYFKVKNSWGSIGPYDGFLQMSLPYYAMKTVGIMVHKDALPKKLRTKLKL